MREFLEDALEHRDDGYGRAQKHLRRELPKRFYKDVGVAPVEGGYAVTLDGRQTRTPTKVPVVVPHLELAQRMASEWHGQGDFIDPDLMPHVRLINSGIEGGEAARDPLVAEVVKFCGSDLLFYRADSPRELVARQEEIWDDALVRVARYFSVTFEPTVGILHKEQAPETIDRLRNAIAEVDHLTATALVSVTGIMGSGVLAIALYEGLVDPEEAWIAAHVDEDYQISNWGEDYEASERRKKRRIEFDAGVNVIRWLKA
ncbi:ATP12 family chaperone protein [Pelagibacterium halotolerans]|uniref:ATP12 family chaperone protein n=1 Tax=Pelagibacterium halotolerans TaxID=531813 RepID=UPI00384FE501